MSALRALRQLTSASSRVVTRPAVHGARTLRLSALAVPRIALSATRAFSTTPSHFSAGSCTFVCRCLFSATHARTLDSGRAVLTKAGRGTPVRKRERCDGGPRVFEGVQGAGRVDGTCDHLLGVTRWIVDGRWCRSSRASRATTRSRSRASLATKSGYMARRSFFCPGGLTSLTCTASASCFRLRTINLKRKRPSWTKKVRKVKRVPVMSIPFVCRFRSPRCVVWLS